jgi:hypothetical protein
MVVVVVVTAVVEDQVRRETLVGAVGVVLEEGVVVAEVIAVGEAVGVETVTVSRPSFLAGLLLGCPGSPVSVGCGQC